MCGRYVPPDEAAMERFWRIDRRNWRGWLTPTFNIAPTQQVPIICKAEDKAIELLGARWGLIPSWWKQTTPPAMTFNARSEEAATKPTWRGSLRHQRCLMPARGWYEWNENEPVRNAAGKQVNQPYFIAHPESEVLAFAGLWSVWDSPNGNTIRSCALLSKAAAPSIADVHHRMPVVLRPAQFEQWLASDATPEQIQGIISDSLGDFVAHRVSTRVNSTRNDGEELLRPVDAYRELF